MSALNEPPEDRVMTYLHPTIMKLVREMNILEHAVKQHGNAIRFRYKDYEITIQCKAKPISKDKAISQKTI